MPKKAMSLRLSEELAARLANVARIEGVPISEMVREAIEDHIKKRRADPEFQKLLRQQLEEDRKALERLAGDS
jgi:predicted transcriptional regulator